MIRTTQEYSYTHGAPLHHHAYLLDPLLQLLPRSQPQQPSLRILDLGCGNGSLTQQLAQAGYLMTGVEESASGIAVARQCAPDCTFIQASIYELPDAELAHAFDGVIAAEVIEHLLYPRALIRAAKKCLKPGGQIVLTTPYHGYWKNLALALLDKGDQHFNPLWDGGHVKFFSVNTLTQILVEEGLTDLHFKFAGRVPYFWKSMLCSSSVATH
ncbi:MAG: methyltransferase domain-containing protein [Leptolyngbyaceae cyanobacterium RU_5_1]|nr:methyltransferase domain-containing protein [Leptolyngbyaceae cyanobacterium RU_5_1]